jgi:hypothetical protein
VKEGTILIFRYLICLAIAWLISSQAYAQYYYGSDGPVHLKIDSNRILIKFEAYLEADSQQALIASIDNIVKKLNDLSVIDGFVSCSLVINIDYDALLESLAKCGPDLGQGL